MSLISLRQLLDHAAEHGYGVPAFNVTNLEQLLSVLEAARRAASPAIVQVSRSARAHITDTMLRHMTDAAVQEYPEIPLCLHQDHADGLRTCLSAIRNGFTSVMMDGSLLEDGKTPSDYDYNVRLTARVTGIAHAVGVSVEGELGALGSLESGRGEAEDGHGAEGVLTRDMLLTDPVQAEEFAATTGVDALAVAIGTSHGAYKFTRKPTADILALDVVKAIHARLPDTHLVLHGSSSVPQELQDLFNASGGAIPQTWGVPVDDIVTAIRFGVRKINIDTDCRIAMVAQFRKVATGSPHEFDIRKFMKPAMAAMTALCIERYEAFGSAGHASALTPLPLSEMARRYTDGDLAPLTVAA